MAAPGRLVAFEGIDGSGKSTQARLLAAAAGAQMTAEPGATPVGAALRRILLDPALPDLDGRTEALLMVADRAEHVAQVLRPSLEAGRWVVTDRYSGSTLAYQGFGRGLELGELRWLVDWATGGLSADLNVVLAVDVGTALDRADARHRAGATSGDIGPARPVADRIERRGHAFQERVAAGFAELASAEPERWAVVDGSGPVEVVAAAVRVAVAERLGDPPGGWR